MERCPWKFDKHVLLMEETDQFVQPSKIVLNKAIFWLQIHDLPIGAMKESIIHKIGSKAGRVIHIGHQKDNYLGAKYARVRVEICVNKPLVRGTQLKIRDNEPIFVQFKYERCNVSAFDVGDWAMSSGIARNPIVSTNHISTMNRYEHNQNLVKQESYPVNERADPERCRSTSQGKIRPATGEEQTTEPRRPHRRNRYADRP